MLTLQLYVPGPCYIELAALPIQRHVKYESNTHTIVANRDERATLCSVVTQN